MPIIMSNKAVKTGMEMRTQTELVPKWESKYDSKWPMSTVKQYAQPKKAGTLAKLQEEFEENAEPQKADSDSEPEPEPNLLPMTVIPLMSMPIVGVAASPVVYDATTKGRWYSVPAGGLIAVTLTTGHVESFLIDQPLHISAPLKTKEVQTADSSTQVDQAISSEETTALTK